MLEFSFDENTSNKQSSFNKGRNITNDKECSLPPPQNAGCIFIPSHFDLGCEPQSSLKKSDFRISEGEGAGSLCIPTNSPRSLSTVITSSNMLVKPFPPSSQLPNGSKDKCDGGSSMAESLTRLVESGAQDSNHKLMNKIPSNVNNHNIKNATNERSVTPVDISENIPVNMTSTSSLWTKGENKKVSVDEYKQRWAIPLECRLVGGGESSLNSNNPSWTAASNNSTVGASSSNNNSAAIPTSSSWSNSQQTAASNSSSSSNAWASATTGSNSGNNNSGRQTSSSISSPNNASHQSNTVQTISNNTSSNSGSNPATNNPSATPTSWAQAAGKNLPTSTSNTSGSSNNANNSVAPSNQNTNNTNNPTNNNGNNGGNNINSPNGNAANCVMVNGNGNPSATSTKQQLEQLNSMREALFSQDGWGGQHVNQDSAWDVPASPEPPPIKDSTGNPTVPWKPNVNNGTDLWEANLRNGGQPPAQTVQKTPWGHTPASNIGGTWGEDDDTSDSSNVWSGTGNTNVNSVQQWGSASTSQTPMWNNKKDEWNATGSNWNDPRDINRTGNGIDPRSNVDLSHMRPVIDHRNINNDGIIRGDPRGITGRLNGTPATDQMWNGPAQQPPGPGPHHHVNPGGPPTVPAQASKLVSQGPVTGANKVATWKDISVGNANLTRNTIQCPPGASLQQSRLSGTNINAVNAGGSVPGMKPDQPLWNHPRNGSWGDNGPHDMNQAPWGDDKITSWNDASLSWNNPQKPKTPMTPGGWVDGDADTSWGHAGKMGQGPKVLTKDIVWASKQFRILTDMNYKKEDVESALKASNMVLEDALEYLNATRCGIDNWRRHDADASSFDHSSNQQPFQSHRMNPQQQLPFNMPSGGNANNSNNFNVNHVMSQKAMSQHHSQPTQTYMPQASHTNQNNGPSSQQLRVLVQQIQLAVTAGYLNQQILNQPLAPQTLLLLNQLLSHIKTIQQCNHHQQLLSATKNSNNNNTIMALNIQISKLKQQIQALQSQIGAQQSIFLKQHPQHHSQSQNQQNMAEYFKMQEPMNVLPNNFSDLSINKDSQMGVNFKTSRLMQWKLPPLDKDDISLANEFSRAPGTTAKNPNPGSPSLNPIMGQNDNTWSISGRMESATWPDSMQEMSDNKDWGQNSVPVSTFNDLVPEFEPGKPWKGSQVKNIEDDPSITPGSVRSPLSLGNIKDDIFNASSNGNNGLSGKTSPNSVDMPLSISASSTWSFNVASPGSTSASFTSPLGKAMNNSGVSKSSWNDMSGNVAPSGDLWGMSRARGPTPMQSLSINKNSQLGIASTSGPNANGWGNQPTPRWPVQNMINAWGNGNSSWLLLRNITPQVDSSTLKTLCMQHGPLQSFHLFLNQGLAFAKYGSREEACKGLGALNNCVLANTSIHVESPSEMEVQNMLQHLQQQNSLNSWNQTNNQNKRIPITVPVPTPASTDTWSNNAGSSQLWPSTLWGTASGLDNPDPHRATPSSLTSFLPGDLLGGESM